MTQFLCFLYLICDKPVHDTGCQRVGEKIPFEKKRVGTINDFAMLCLRCQKINVENKLEN